jgi:flagellar motor protein MotB
MKLVGVISAAVLSLTLGIAAPTFAQQEQHEQEEQKEKPAQQQEKKTQSEKPAKQEEKSAPQEKKNTKQEEGKAPQQQQHGQQAKPGQQAQRASGNGGGRIPEDHFRAHFGQEHRFRVSEGDYRNHRFQYGGYWFGFADPWPSNWLYTQDVFIIEINGVYYLCNASYPGVNLTLSFAP